MTVLISATQAQINGNRAVTGQEPVLSLAFDQKDFGDRFSVLVSSDDFYDYYALDLTKLGGRTEKVYFMTLTYDDKRVVNIDADIEKEHTWFKSYYKYTENEISCLFNELREKTIQDCSKMNESEKSAWLVRNDKFKKPAGNE